MADSEAQVLPTPKSLSVLIYQAKQGLGTLVAFQVGDAVPMDGCLPATTVSARATSQLRQKKILQRKFSASYTLLPPDPVSDPLAGPSQLQSWGNVFGIT